MAEEKAGIEDTDGELQCMRLYCSNIPVYSQLEMQLKNSREHKAVINTKYLTMYEI